MRAVVIENGALRVAEREDPVPGTGELLVRVEAAGVNGADLLQRAGHYPAPPGSPPDIPGLECAGTVVAAGPGTTRHSVGERVMGIVGGGAQAELCILHDTVALSVPGNLSWPQAGGFPEVVTTAHDALFAQCHLGPGERLLVTGAAGGVGTAAVQLGRLAGAHVVASVRREELREQVASLGANLVIDPAGEGAHGPYDVVIEIVGAGAFGEHVRALATGGRIVFIGVTGTGSRTELDARELMSRRAVVRGSTLRARSLEEKAATARALQSDALGWLATGDLAVNVHATFLLEDVEEAYGSFAAGGKLGKVVLLAGEA